MTHVSKLVGALAVATGLAFASMAHAADADKLNLIDELAVWYAAHSDGFDRDASVGAVDAALAPDATIVLTALDITQTKSDYLDSFEGWRDAIEGGIVAHRVDENDGSRAVVTVCYTFESSAVMNRETIVFNPDLQITELVAEQIAENCDSF
ncbi:MAG: hypothetical protein AAFO77_07950 [Pseudomonadota bacterium]